MLNVTSSFIDTHNELLFREHFFSVYGAGPTSENSHRKATQRAKIVQAEPRLLLIPTY